MFENKKGRLTTHKSKGKCTQGFKTGPGLVLHTLGYTKDGCQHCIRLLHLHSWFHYHTFYSFITTTIKQYNEPPKHTIVCLVYHINPQHLSPANLRTLAFSFMYNVCVCMYVHLHHAWRLLFHKHFCISQCPVLSFFEISTDP